MAQITYYAPAGVTSINLSDGSVAVVRDGKITADSKFRSELESAGFTGEAPNVVSEQMTRLGMSPMLDPSFSGAQKCFGSVIGNSFLNVSAGNGTAAIAGRYKMEAEAPFDGVQFVIVNASADPIGPITMLANVTETAGYGSANEISQPIIGGVPYTSLVGSGNLGHRAVTFGGGNSSVTLPLSLTSIQLAVSDMLDIDYVPRADGGDRPLMQYSFQYAGGAAGVGSYRFLGTNFFGMTRLPNDDNKGRILQSCSITNAVSTPSGTASVMNNSGLEIFPIFRYLVPSLTVMVVGDSTEMGLESISQYASWGFMGCADASTPDRPINYINVGCSGRSSDEYWARAKELMAAGVSVDVLVIGPISVNDDYKTNYSTKLAAMLKRRADIVRTAKQYGVKNLCFIPLKPHNVNTTADDANRKTLNALNKAFASAVPGIHMLDFDALGDKATPERWKPEYNASKGHHGVLLNLPKTEGSATGYVSATQYTAGITVDGTVCNISFLGSEAPTFGALCSVLNAQINAQKKTTDIQYARMYGGTILLRAAKGNTSINITTAGTAFASPLAGFVAVTSSLLVNGSADGLHENHEGARFVMAPELTDYLNSI